MATNRNPAKTGTIDGADYIPENSDNIAALWAKIGGIAQSVAGTNTVTFGLTDGTGFSAYTDGFLVFVTHAATNTGAVTFNVESVGAKAAVNNDGTAFAGGELVSGATDAFVFSTTEDAFVSLRQITASTGDSKPFTRTKLITATGAFTFTFPHAADFMIYAVGGGGSGGIGTSGTAAATGGAGAGFAQKYGSAASGDEITGSVGAGGSGVTGHGLDGNNGSSTTVTSSDISGLSLTASGGEGGNLGTTGATGGTASGGDINVQGGSSTTGVTSNGEGPNFFEGLTSNPAGFAKYGLDIGSGAFNGSAGTTSSNSSDGGIGAGSGGITNGSTISRTSGDGGDGFVMIFYSEDKSA